MISHFLKRVGISVGALTGIVVAAGIITSRAQADQYDKMTLFTVDQPTQVGDTYLDPGTYMFKLADSSSDRHIVQIFNSDRSHLINTILAIPSYRVFRTGTAEVSFWETPPGTAKAIRTWFYPGDHDGQEFRYPTELRQIAAVTTQAQTRPLPPVESDVTPPPPAVATEPEPPAPQTVEQVQPTVELAPSAADEAPPAAEQAPVEIAQNTPPAAEAAPIPATQAPSEEQTLPKTSSPYPLFGLGGLLCLGLYGFIRVKTLG